MTWTIPAALAALMAALMLAAAVSSLVGTGLVLRLLRARAILDHPNERSSHDRAVPRGGGIAVMAVAAGGWALLAWWQGFSINLLAAAGLAAALAAVSFLDDLRGLPVLRRLMLQALAVALGCLLLPETPVFQGLLPGVADRLLAGFFWLWFINLFNFMDGIDGITAVEAGSIGLGIVLLTALGGTTLGGAPELGPPAAIVAGAVLGFGVWNWHPAKIFLGDVGSVGLGFLLGWLLLSLAAQGQWLPALLLPLYYLTDATWTLLRRMLRGEKFWRAHRSHFYQHAARGLGNHGAVSLRVLGCNLVLMAEALFLDGWMALALGGVAVALLLYNFATIKEQPSAVDGADET